MESTSIEKLMEKTENRYEAVMVAARRARQINREKEEALREDEKEKVTIRALRELLEGKVDFKYEKKEKRK
jgi:DNA-directed RNA polymerase subunit omega